MVGYGCVWRVRLAGYAQGLEEGWWHQIRPGFSNSILEFWLRKNSESRLKYKENFILKLTEVEEVSRRRNGLRKQVTEAKEGPLELRRQRGRENVPGGRGWGALGTCSRESPTGSSFSRAFIWRPQRQIPMEYSSAFQVCPFRVMVPTDCLVLEQGLISHCCRPCYQPWHRFSGVAAFLGLELKYS